MKQKIFLRYLSFLSGNLKPVLSKAEGSKTCTEPGRSIENLKWAGLFAIVVALTVCGARAEAQQTGKVARIGYLDPSTVAGNEVRLEAFRQELSKLGWIEGKNLTIEYRFAEQKNDRLPELAAELVRLKVALIVTSKGRWHMKKKHIGSSFDSWLREEGIYEEVAASAIKRVLARQVVVAMKERKLSKSEMARRMHTSRAALDRLLDPEYDAITLNTLKKAATAVGRQLRLELI